MLELNSPKAQSGLKHEAGPSANPLTDRELEVLRLMAGGFTNPQIVRMLSISPHTVKSPVIHIFNKLCVNDRTRAAVCAVQTKNAKL